MDCVPGFVSQINSSLPGLLLVVIFLTATESKLRQGVVAQWMQRRTDRVTGSVCVCPYSWSWASACKNQEASEKGRNGMIRDSLVAFREEGNRAGSHQKGGLGSLTVLLSILFETIVGLQVPLQKLK